MRRVALAAALLAWAGHGWTANDNTLARQREQARQEQAELRARIKLLQKDIDLQHASRKAADQALKESETAISDISRRLADLAQQIKQITRELDDLATQERDKQKALGLRRKELAAQLRAQYTSGLSPWTALLSGDDPRTIGRDLGYLSYVSRAQAQAVIGVNAAIKQVQAVQQQTRQKRDQLAGLTAETKTRESELLAQKSERQAVYERISAELRKQQGQAQQLARDEASLSKLISGLEAEIARQEELARQAEERRRQEAQRRAEEARLAAQEQQRALEQEREKARQAQRAAQEARQQAERERLQREATQARLQVERARAESEEADRAAAQKRAEAATLRGEAAAGGPQGAMSGLAKNLPKPVNGEIQGRFGAQRPEGGIWRGIVLRATEGTHVRAVAPGRVAYANWLGGFGNIIIVDHGKQYLSVYAYNQSLLKDVGEPVGAGDVIATVGATGGQVEPGLYFEIRHHGKPVNPQLWLKQ